MIGPLVDQGLISWDTTPGEVLKLRDTSRQGDVLTLAHLLTHTGGVPSYCNPNDFDDVPEFKGDAREQRRQFARWVLPQRRATGEYEYSAASYLIAASMAETVTGKSWEALMEEYLFEPLGIDAVIAGVFPKNDFAVAVTANACSGQANGICKEVITAMISLYWDWRWSISGEQITEPDRLNAPG